MTFRTCWTLGLTMFAVAGLGGVSTQAQPPGGFGGGFGGLLEIVRRDDVRKEVRLSDDQSQKLDQLSRSRGEKMRRLLSGLEGVPREERFQKMRELFQRAQQETEKEIGAILQPPQMQRLKQIALQFRLQGGTFPVLNERARELKLTPDQKENLRKKAAELEEQVRRKIAQLRKQKQDDLIKTLTPEQQAKWKELVGEPFEFRRPEQTPGRNKPGEQPRRGEP